ncbi:hypothetical protein GOBAR_AA32340 [Gossypium barbadense]|uniref:Uncharacterized protein n=1 Tax=Gossypium barbadense TaxID=3634 RepID=A0A2P5WB88_GOSBA|nr:hypothetical protein GOBAR_AA32340 [Gossypium barbadense]
MGGSVIRWVTSAKLGASLLSGRKLEDKMTRLDPLRAPGFPVSSVSPWEQVSRATNARARSGKLGVYRLCFGSSGTAGARSNFTMEPESGLPGEGAIGNIEVLT